jgi:diacylglycerol kinase family enzyme
LFQIFTVKDDVTRTDLIQLLIDFDTGEHVNHPKINRYFTKAYRLVPNIDNYSNGIYTLDGEVIEYGPIQGVIEKGKAKTLKL